MLPGIFYPTDSENMHGVASTDISSDEAESNKISLSWATGTQQQHNTMSIELEVKCINKTNRSSPHERISHIGGIHPISGSWKLELNKAISLIENDGWSFYVNVNRQKVKVIIAKSAQGNKYLKTENDGEQPNNLLSLPECP